MNCTPTGCESLDDNLLPTLFRHPLRAVIPATLPGDLRFATTTGYSLPALRVALLNFKLESTSIITAVFAARCG